MATRKKPNKLHTRDPAVSETPIPAIDRIICGIRELLDGGMSPTDLAAMLNPAVKAIVSELAYQRGQHDLRERVKRSLAESFDVPGLRTGRRQANGWNQMPVD